MTHQHQRTHTGQKQKTKHTTFEHTPASIRCSLCLATPAHCLNGCWFLSYAVLCCAVCVVIWFCVCSFMNVWLCPCVCVRVVVLCCCCCCVVGWFASNTSSNVVAIRESELKEQASVPTTVSLNPAAGGAAQHGIAAALSPTRSVPTPHQHINTSPQPSTTTPQHTHTICTHTHTHTQALQAI